jgi:hypothetical protein
VTPGPGEGHQDIVGELFALLRAYLMGAEVGKAMVSPSNPLLDYQIKRDLYLLEGVGEYWVISPEARNVSRWRGRDDPGEILSKEVVWHPEGLAEPFVLDLPRFFSAAFA